MWKRCLIALVCLTVTLMWSINACSMRAWIFNGKSRIFSVRWTRNRVVYSKLWLNFQLAYLAFRWKRRLRSQKEFQSMVFAACLWHGEQWLEENGNSVRELKNYILLSSEKGVICQCFHIRYLYYSCFCLNANYLCSSSPEVMCKSP